MEYKYRKGKWETCDHRVFLISEMDTEHIRNTIKFLEIRPYFYDEIINCGWAVDNDYIEYEHIDNSKLVQAKIEELQRELDWRERYGSYQW